MLLQRKLYDDVDLLAVEQGLALRQQARPRPAAASLYFAPFHAEIDVRAAAGTAGDDFGRQFEDIFQNGRKYLAVGAGRRCADGRGLLGQIVPGIDAAVVPKSADRDFVRDAADPAIFSRLE